LTHVRVKPVFRLAYCPNGPGVGVDPSCKPGGGGGKPNNKSSKDEAQRKSDKAAVASGDAKRAENTGNLPAAYKAHGEAAAAHEAAQNHHEHNGNHIQAHAHEKAKGEHVSKAFALFQKMKSL